MITQRAYSESGGGVANSNSEAGFTAAHHHWGDTEAATQ